MHAKLCSAQMQKLRVYFMISMLWGMSLNCKHVYDGNGHVLYVPNLYLWARIQAGDMCMCYICQAIPVG